MIELKMYPQNLIKHNRLNTPCYLLWVHERPTQSGKGKKVYMDSLKNAAKQEINNPIETFDVEIEVLYSARFTSGTRKDIDNILKPTLDALIKVAYIDDKQVRSVTASLFVKGDQMRVQGYAQYLGPLIYSETDHAVLVAIYSDSRLIELGGEEKVRADREKRELNEIQIQKNQNKNLS